jgi:hypothetical protein
LRRVERLDDLKQLTLQPLKPHFVPRRPLEYCFMKPPRQRCAGDMRQQQAQLANVAPSKELASFRIGQEGQPIRSTVLKLQQFERRQNVRRCFQAY